MCKECKKVKGAKRSTNLLRLMLSTCPRVARTPMTFLADDILETFRVRWQRTLAADFSCCMILSTVSSKLLFWERTLHLVISLFEDWFLARVTRICMSPETKFKVRSRLQNDQENMYRQLIEVIYIPSISAILWAKLPLTLFKYLIFSSWYNMFFPTSFISSSSFWKAYKQPIN